MSAAPSPMELWEQARRELPDETPDSPIRAGRYRELMIEHGHLVVADRGYLDISLPEPACTCPHLKLGSEVLEQRNWNPDCAKHGTGSDWYRSPEQVAHREAVNARLRDLQTRAREARRAAAPTQGGAWCSRSS